MEEIKRDEKEKALLLGVNCGEEDAEAAMDELVRLADTAGADVQGTMLQNRRTPESGTYVGRGLLKEIADFCKANDTDLIICNDELTPTQIKNMEDETDVRVIDRTDLILDIFAAHAKSSEGKIQVELAQLQYLLPRLAGRGAQLSRLGGGIGTRGPGETKLESDRRHIRRRIQFLKAQLAQTEKRRRSQLERRKKDGVRTVALVGYTNAGKSTLMNRLTDAGVLAEDKLFATLDPTARRLTLPDGQNVMLIDTVGFIRRLPHRLIEAFHSTLEAAVYADLILNVCDAADPNCFEQMKVTADVLTALGAAATPMLTVLNKSDRLQEAPVFMGKTVTISAKNGDGIAQLLREITAALPQTKKRARLFVPFAQAAVLGEIRKNGVVYSEHYTEAGIEADVLAEAAFLQAHRELLL